MMANSRPLITAKSNKSLDVRAKQLLFKILRGFFQLARGWFRPTSIRSLIKTFFSNVFHRVFYQHINNRKKIIARFGINL